MSVLRSSIFFRQRRRGSTLLEVALVVLITGIAVVALMESMSSGTRINATLDDYYIGTTIAKTGQEWVATRSEAQLLAFFGDQTERAADQILDASGGPIINKQYAAYSEVFSYRKVSDTNPAATDGRGGFYEVKVSVKKGGGTVCSLTRLHDPS